VNVNGKRILHFNNLGVILCVTRAKLITAPLQLVIIGMKIRSWRLQVIGDA